MSVQATPEVARSSFQPLLFDTMDITPDMAACTEKSSKQNSVFLHHTICTSVSYKSVKYQTRSNLALRLWRDATLWLNKYELKHKFPILHFSTIMQPLYNLLWSLNREKNKKYGWLNILAKYPSISAESINKYFVKIQDNRKNLQLRIVEWRWFKWSYYEVWEWRNDTVRSLS